MIEYLHPSRVPTIHPSSPSKHPEPLTTDTTVLVIEAGPFHKNEDWVEIPLITTANLAALGNGPRGSGRAFDFLPHFFYDANLTSLPQPLLSNRSIGLPAGRVIGGSSVLNGMVFMRGNKLDYDRLGDFFPSDSASKTKDQNWSWENLLPFFKKSEHYTPPDADEEEVKKWGAGVGWNGKFHGDSGGVQYGFPRFVWPSTGSFIRAFQSLNHFLLPDPFVGLSASTFLFTLSLNHDSQTRCTSQSFISPPFSSSPKPNLHILPSYTATRILLSNSSYNSHQSPRATGVSFAASNSSSTSVKEYTVHAKKEVIVSAGTLRTPQLLQVSGIGGRAVLEAAGVDVKVELEGVGEGYVDHGFVVSVGSEPNIAVQTGNFSNATWAAEMRKLYDEKREGPFTTASANTLAFLPFKNITDNQTISTLTSMATTQSGTQYLDPSTPPSVRRGYALYHSLLTQDLLSTATAHIEFIVGDTVQIACVQHPYSRGWIRINSSSVFSPPLINPRYLTNPLDILQMEIGFNYTRTLRTTSELKSIGMVEVYPGETAQTKAQIEEYIKTGVQTINHHAGSAGMMAKELGGVVDQRLRVYGVQGLRVVDASTIVWLPAAHLQATVYAVAERGASMILDDNQ
ncbi:hypothetical protein CJF31_00002859 [Rutstroemia sp. NJR-2017a BVV2]|nr:hypothetical protein CJF31_00002859 [Rutstroemia sp. NJR-2017a BVV2]